MSIEPFKVLLETLEGSPQRIEKEHFGTRTVMEVFRWVNPSKVKV